MFEERKKLHTFLVAVSCFFIIIGLMFMTTDFVVQSRAFYNWQFDINDAEFEVGLDREQLNAVRDQLRDYFGGRSGTLQIYVIFEGEIEPSPFYTEDELSHMEDVYYVFLGFRITAWILLLTGIIVLVTLGIIFRKNFVKKFIRALSSGAIIGGAAFLSVIIVLALLIVATWERAFEIFHYIFFPQGNWQFANSNMINMLPGTLFMHAGLIIAGVGIGVAVIFVIIGIIGKVLIKIKCKAQNI